MIPQYMLKASYLTLRIFLLIGGILVSATWIIAGGKKYFGGWFKSRDPKNFLYSLFQSIIFLPQIFGVPFFPLPQFFFTPILQIIGLIIFYIGVIFAVWARITMGKSWGLPGTWDDKREKKLIEEGPFHYSRNPIYIGILLMCLGFELGLNSYLIILTIPLYIYFHWEIQKEEKILEKEFREKYFKYKKNIPRIFWF